MVHKHIFYLYIWAQGDMSMILNIYIFNESNLCITWDKYRSKTIPERR